MQKSLGAISVGLLGVGSIVVPTGASATTPECGTSTSSMTISSASGICQAEFSEAGSSTFTVPSVARDLAAILVGAGGGAYVDADSGYAGSGGEVNYLDLSQSATPGTVLSLTVGAGGASSAAPTFGGDTSVTVASAPTLAEGGGVGAEDGNFPPSCVVDGFFGQLGQGFGAGGDPVADGHPGYACISPGPGVTPSARDLDSATKSVAEIFSNYSIELGKGGYLAEHTESLVEAPGQGASVQINLLTNIVVTPSPAGSDGLVVFRWYPTERNALPATGQSTIQTLATAAVSLLMVALGLAFLSNSQRMRRRSS
jgi:hypothetical protein